MSASKGIYHTANILVGVVGAATASTPVGVAGAAMASIGSVLELVALTRGRVDPIAERVATELQRALDTTHLSQSARTLIPQMIEQGVPTPAEIMGAQRRPAAICTLMLAQLDGKDPAFFPPLLQQAFRDIVTPILTDLLSDPEICETLRPAFEDLVSESLSAIEARQQQEALAADLRHAEQLRLQLQNTQILAQIQQGFQSLFGSDLSSDVILRSAISGIRRLDNAETPGRDLRDRIRLAVDEGRREDAISLADAHDALVLDQNREINRADFSVKMVRAGLYVEAEKYPEAIDAFGKALAATDGVDPNEVSAAEVDRQKTIHKLAASAKTFADAKSIYAQGYTPPFNWDLYAYSILIARAESFAAGKALLDEMADKGRAPDVITYTSLIAKAESFAAGKSLLDEMADKGLAPNVITYTSLIVLSPTEGQAASYYTAMKRDGLAPDLAAFTTLIDLSSDFPRAYGYFKAMLKARVQPDRFVMQVMIRKAPSFLVALDLLSAMLSKLGMHPDLRAWSTGVRKARNATDARLIV